MCLVFLVGGESVDRYWELKLAGRERRRIFRQRFLPWLRPKVDRDQHVALQHHCIEDGKPPNYVSETTLILKKEAAA